METKSRKVVFMDDLRAPRGITVHPGTGTVFWTDRDFHRPKIEMANMDGSDRQDLVNVNLGEPNSLVTDYFNYKICWSDGGNARFSVTPRIDCIDTNGAGRRMVIGLSEGDFPYGLAMTENNIFWTDWRNPKVHSVDKVSGERQQPINYQFVRHGRPYDLVNVPEECPNLLNSCRSAGCPDNKLCLPNGRGGHTCACSDEAKKSGCTDSYH